MTNHFDPHAASWDEKEYRVILAASVTAAIRREVSLNREMHVLDFGCGTGLVSLPLAPEVALLTGVDNSAAMLEIFESKAAAMNLDNVRSLNLDLSGGDRLSGSYDLILSSMTLHHVKETTLVLQNMYDALKPGGHLCIADLDPDQGLFHADNTHIHHFGFERGVMLAYFKSVGLINGRAVTAGKQKRLGVDGVEREFSIFLAAGMKPGQGY